ncbi:MAG TPA: hypothetical protein PKD28_03640 [Candidatus Saccharibacteria bacterium]|nr:hypothetical protein [Candidatus Saccharibacteria bacterium]
MVDTSMRELLLQTPATDGHLRVSLSTGGDVLLPLSGLGAIRRIDENAALNSSESEAILELIEYCWPAAPYSEAHLAPRVVPLGNGTTLCDMIEVFRDSEVALAILEYGRLQKWWKLVYDRNQRCLNCGTEEAHIGCHCVVRLDEFRRPTRRAKQKREREPLLSKFRDFLSPDRGIAIA